MSDHWKALADLLGTPPLDRGTVEPSQDVEATKSSVKTVDKISEMEEGVSSEKSSPSTSNQQPKAVENQKNMEEKSSVTPAVPKRSAGWDALARLFGLSAPPPDADVPLPESPKEKEPEARVAPAAPPAAKQAPAPKPAPVSKPVEDELDLTQLGWPAPKQPKNDPSRERASQQDRSSPSESLREPAVRETREPAARENSGRDRGGRDGGREGGNRDRNDRGRRPDREATQTESTGRERGNRESSPRDTAPPRENVTARETVSPRGNEPRENEPRESGRRERGGRDRNPRDGNPRDTASRDSGSRETREAPARDVVAADGERSERNERRSGRDQRNRPRDGRSPDRRSERLPERVEARRDDAPIYDEPFVEVDADDVDDLSFGPPRGRAEKPRPAAPAWEVEAEADFEEVTDEGAMPERRGRRRRGRRRGGAGRSETGRSETGRSEAGRGEAGRGEVAETRPSTRPEERDNRSKRDVPKRAIEDADLDYEADVIDGAPIDDLATPIEPSASERRGRRRRRRGGRRQETSVGSGTDLDSDELDLSEGYNLPGLLADEIEASEDDDERHAKIPTWEETLKILVTTNIEARHRPDQKGGGGNRHGGGHQGGGHGNGGNHGGRGRGGNRNQGKR